MAATNHRRFLNVSMPALGLHQLSRVRVRDVKRLKGVIVDYDGTHFPMAIAATDHMEFLRVLASTLRLHQLNRMMVDEMNEQTKVALTPAHPKLTPTPPHPPNSPSPYPPLVVKGHGDSGVQVQGKMRSR